ncbi:Na/Pi cotransporter family protein [Lutimonas zeaxanthinifaciens]|uniref:Na/Pi cotransporter family protein n=1 Tax=Lutimonas zeaxanthinifaciens TaxID=3060215 RepID=UPI00265C9FEA|nr:Na/Pi symporter [Lutimonas sp. YSD2104]WKK66180.1 Na/Pi symporter [Lutimonas sp. YSD2104]
MIKRWIFLIVLVLLAVLLFLNPNFKTIAAGVSILLFGMITLEEGFKVFTKGPLKLILKKMTDKLYKSISLGAIVTAFIQSSSLVSVITISFISAGLISLAGGIGLIFGANIGTTATAWLVAGFGLKIKISVLAMPMLIFGIIFSFQKKKTLKGIGNVLTGLGFFFLGIHYMKEGFDVFSQYFDLTVYAVPGFLGVIIYTGIGIFITTILQSSSASLALILTALSAGQIEYENALALAIGTNIGTTITALIGSVGTNVAGKRLALAHLVFNLVTGLVALACIYPLANLVNKLSEVVGIANTDYTLKLALFHTIFNVIGVLIMIPFIKKLETLLIKIVKESGEKDIDEPKYLNSSTLEFATTAISSLESETKYLFENAIFEIVTHSLNIHRSDILSTLRSKDLIKKSEREIEIDIRNLYMHKVKTIYGKILEFATLAQSELELSKEQHQRISEIKIANRKMVEIIRDVKELRRNIAIYTYSDNVYIKKEYNKFRRRVVKVLRAIYIFKTDESRQEHYDKLVTLKNKSKEKSKMENKSINNLIRKNLITTNMASSLVNDHDNVNEMIQKLIEVGQLLYAEKDSILEPIQN